MIFHGDDAYELLEDGTVIRYRHSMWSHGETVLFEELPDEVKMLLLPLTEQEI